MPPRPAFSKAEAFALFKMVFSRALLFELKFVWLCMRESLEVVI